MKFTKMRVKRKKNVLTSRTEKKNLQFNMHCKAIGEIWTVVAGICKTLTTVLHSKWHFRFKNCYAIFNVMNIIWTRYLCA